MGTRHFAAIAGVVLVGSVVAAAAANAAIGPAPSRVDPVVMAQSLRQQLDGHAGAYQFAISVDGRLELTGEGGGMTPLTDVDGTNAVQLVKGAGNVAGAFDCRVDFPGPVSAALIVGEAHADLPQLCAVLGLAYDAAR